MIMNTIRKIYLAALALVTLSMGGCVDTINTNDIATEYNRPYSLAAPLVNIRASGASLFDKLEEEMLIGEYDDGSLYGFFKTNVEIGLPNVLTFSDQHADLVLPAFKSPYLVSTGTSKVTSKLKMNDIPSVRYDSLTFYTGQMGYDIKLPANTTGTLKIEFPELYDTSNQRLVISTPITAAKTQYTGTTDLSQYKVKFAHGVDSSYFRAITTITFINTPSNVNATSEFHFTLSQISPEVVFGFFGKRLVNNGLPMLVVDIFDKNHLGEIVEFADLHINVVTENHVGASFAIGVKDLAVKNTETQESKSLTFTESDTRILRAAAWTNRSVPTIDSFKLSKANSNIMDIVAINANQASCSFEATINPDNSSPNNFITRDSKVNTRLELEVPLWFRVKDYNRKDTIDFDLEDMFGSDIDQVDRVEFLKLYLQNTNGFPFDIKTQAYLANGSYQVIDSLFGQGQQSICKACTTKANLRLDKPTSLEIIAELDKAKIKKLRDAKVKYIILASKANTPSTSTPQEFIKIFKDNYMENFLQFAVSGVGTTK
jgi:hypothetical protein